MTCPAIVVPFQFSKYAMSLLAIVKINVPFVSSRKYFLYTQYRNIAFYYCKFSFDNDDS